VLALAGTPRRYLAAAVTLAVLAALPGCRADDSAPAPAPVPRTVEPQVTLEPPPGAPEPTRPNILVVNADDMRADDLRFMPRSRRLLARQGLDFRNSFAPNPLCCPSRASFLTGRYSHNHQVLSHVEPYGFRSLDDRDTLATALRDAGYATGMIGKYLNGYGLQPTRTGADSLRYVPPGWSDWWGSTDRAFSAGGLVYGGTYDFFNLASNVNGEIRTWPGRYTTEVTGEQARAMVDRFAEGEDGGDRPWFVWWNPVAPHHGEPGEPDDPAPTLRDDGYPVDWVTPARPEWVKGRFDDLVPRGAGVPESGSPEPDRSDKPMFIRRPPGLNPAELAALTTVTRQRAEALYVLDQEVARTVEHLRAAGLAEDTLVVLTSDNGYYLGEHAKRQGKITLHEPSIRVPLLMAGPGVPRGRRFDPVSTVDLAATLAGYAGAELSRADGRDLRRVVREGDEGWSRPVVLEGRMGEAAYAGSVRSGDGDLDGLNTVGIRLGRWKLVHYSTGEKELYDLRKDPLELRNLAGRAPRLQRPLERVWRQWTACAEDACREPVPKRLRLTPTENRRLTERQEQREAEYYGRDEVVEPRG
jgi:N-acetylglucosamine-6-sulfatase